MAEDGEIGVSGQSVLQFAEEEFRPDLRNVITLPQPMVELIVTGRLQKFRSVTLSRVQVHLL